MLRKHIEIRKVRKIWAREVGGKPGKYSAMKAYFNSIKMVNGDKEH